MKKNFSTDILYCKLLHGLKKQANKVHERGCIQSLSYMICV